MQFCNLTLSRPDGYTERIQLGQVETLSLIRERCIAMRERTGDWRDVLSAYTMALDAKKLYMGFVATIGTVLVIVFAAMLHGALVGSTAVAAMGDLSASDHIFQDFLHGNVLSVLKTFLPVLNPFHAGIGHFITSVIFYVLLLAVWSFMGAVITRITALEYGRDELPTLTDGMSMAKSKYAAYFFAPLSPLIGVAIFALLNALGGLIGSIPYVGPILMIVGIVPWFISTVIILFIAALGVISFGFMYPAISIGGKDAFEGWSSAYSYVLWGFNKFIGYSVIACLIGLVSTAAAWFLCEFFIYVLLQTIDFGYVAGQSWVVYSAFTGPYYTTELFTPSGFSLLNVSRVCMLVALLCVRAVPAAYLISYFFTANTVVCFLLRKHVDRIDIDEVYEEQEEEEEFGEAVEEPVAPPAEAEEAEEVEEEAEEAAEKEVEEEEEETEEEELEEEEEKQEESDEPEAESEEEEEEDTGSEEEEDEEKKED